MTSRVLIVARWPENQAAMCVALVAALKGGGVAAKHFVDVYNRTAPILVLVSNKEQ
jgi:hypothetical protein